MTSAPAGRSVVVHQGQGDARWFLGGLCTIKASGDSTAGRAAVIENWAPRGHGSPMHVHHREDEWFYVLSGELTFAVGGETVVATAGSFVYGPRDVPHTFMVTSDEARFLLVVEPAGFESFLLQQSEPARTLTLPPASGDSPPIEAMVAAAAEYGIEILGPPGLG